MTRDAHGKLGEIATSLGVSQSSLLETVIWMTANDNELLDRIRTQVKEKAEVEGALRERLRGLSAKQAKALLDRLKDK
jgi:hypothetical protein